MWPGDLMFYMPVGCFRQWFLTYDQQHEKLKNSSLFNLIIPPSIPPERCQKISQIQGIQPSIKCLGPL